MDDMMLIALGTLGMLLLAVGVFIARRNKMSSGTDYRGIFILGLIFLPVGLVFDYPILTILGAIYVLLGIVNKDKWGKAQKESHNTSVKPY
jgi:hypothetical protein